MLVTYNELCRFVNENVVENSDISLVNGASIDVRLGSTIWRERYGSHNRIVHLANKEVPAMYAVENENDEGWDLEPGEFILASTIEKFNLPYNLAFEFKLKSSLARAGLQHLLAGWADPGWHGSVLTLELRNALAQHSLHLKPGMKIGQLVFWKGEEVPHEASYAARGQYNNDNDATPSKGLR